MSENLRDTILWSLGMTLLAGVLCTAAACTAHRHAQITKAIEAGADPMEAKCAIEGYSEDIPCILLAARKEEQK